MYMSTRFRNGSFAQVPGTRTYVVQLLKAQAKFLRGKPHKCFELSPIHYYYYYY